MYHRPIRTIVLCTILIAFVFLLGLLTVRATITLTQPWPGFQPTGSGFQPTGYGFTKPQEVNTATIPQVTIKQPIATSIQPPSSSRWVQAAGPSTMVRVPPPISTDPATKNGLFLNQPKPDVSGAGGLENYLETVAGGVAIYSRAGAQEFESSDQSWFDKAHAQFVDPMTMWDDTGDRFIFSISQLGSRNLWLSVAQQTNALGSYCNYIFNAPSGHDFDHLGVDADGIYLSADVLSPDTGQMVVNNYLFYANRRALESCQPTTYAYWTGLTNPDGTIAQAITPAREDGSIPGIEYLVNSYPAGACKLTLWTLTSSGTLTNTSVPTQCYTPPTQAKQKNSSALISTGDCSITQASLVNGLLTLDTPGSHDWKDGNGPVGIVEWYQLNPRTARVSRQGAFGTPGYWLFYPSAITTANGHMLFVYNASGPSIYPSVWYVNQSLTNTMALANGTSYYDYDNSAVAPWGNYQSVWPDTSMKSSDAVWITGEYGLSPTNWGTKFDLITP